MPALEALRRSADTGPVRLCLLRKLRQDGGFGLVELMIAMLILTVGLLALLSAMVSGSTTLRRASRTATASTLADTQMELYRGLTYGAIALHSSQITDNTDNTYKCDAALGGSAPCPPSPSISTCTGSTCADGTVPVKTCSGNPLPAECQTSRQVTGPDHGIYRVDTYIVYCTPPRTSSSPPPCRPPNDGSGSATAGRRFKLVTIAVRDATRLSSRALARVSSAFDESTGL
jgi:prepilin-type N-terminal cleavage/methylation domain-containing protein